MNYWIFIASNPGKVLPGGGYLSGAATYDQRMKDGFWGLGEKTAHRTHLKKGDLVVWYLAVPAGVFAGTAKLASDSFELTPEDKQKLGHGIPFYTTDHGVYLEDINKWDQGRNVKDLAPYLEFIKNPDQWGVYLQGGVRQISEEDFKIITSGTPPGSPHPANELQDIEIKAQAQFALEAHLEEFMFKNWANIPWESSLELYQDNEQNGRQFPAGTWSIDFLAIDKKDNALVVIELKRNQTSDATIGQLLRYMGWVQENIAQANQAVRGIVVAKEIDDSLRYAAKNLLNVSLKTYEVRFDLNDFA